MSDPHAPVEISALDGLVRTIVSEIPITDIHTHLYDPAIGEPLLSGIDELVTYHYLIAELFRARPDLDIAPFWDASKQEQADLIWKELFVERAPVSEACRGVVTVLQSLGLDPAAKDLRESRAYFDRMPITDRVDRAFELANLDRLFMTNDPADPLERPAWEKGFKRDPRFLGVLRLDSAIVNWPEPVAFLRSVGYQPDEALSGKTIAEVRRYFNEWCDRMDARYLAVSLPPSFRYPDPESPVTNLITHAVLPVAEERGIPFAMMIGVKKLVNPDLRLAGDSVGKASIETVEALARDFPAVRFAVTMLSRENQHELCIAARKFKNLLPFGCWWFLNNPTFIREMTSMRMETLGLSFIPQHSDARILEQIIYKWNHSRALLGEVLADQFVRLASAGRPVTEAEVRRDLARLFDGKQLA